MQYKKAKWPWVFLTIFILSVGIFASRHFLVATAMEWGISYFCGEKFLYSERHVHGKGIEYRDARLGKGVGAESVSITWTCQFFPFYIEPQIEVRGASLKINPEDSNTALAALLLPTKYGGVRLCVEEGKIFLPGQTEGASFSFHPGDTAEELGTLKIGDIVVAQALQTLEGLQLRLSMKEIDVADARDLWGQFLKIPSLASTKVGGILRLDGQVDLDHDWVVREIKADLAIENAVWEKNGTAFEARHIQGAFHYPSGERGALWQQILGAFAWESGYLRMPTAHLQLARGHLYLSPQEEPRFEIEGMMGNALPFTVEGRGVLEEGQIPWVRMQVKVGESLAQLSLNCHDWDLFRLKVDLDNWKEEALRETIKVVGYFIPRLEGVQGVQGSVKGRIEGVIEKGSLSRIEWHHLAMQNIYFEIPLANYQGFLGEVVTSGSLKQRGIHQCEMQIERGVLRYDKWHAEEIQGTLKVVDGVIEPSLFSCKIEGISADVRLEGKTDAPQMKAFLEAPLNAWAALLYHQKNIPHEKMLHVDLSGIFHEGHFDMTGFFKTDGDHGEFGCTLGQDQKITHGWFTVGRATEELYAPFLRPLLPDVTIGGELVVRGKIQGPHVEGYFTFDHPSLTTELVHTKAQKLEEGHFKGDLLSHKWEGEFLLQDGEIVQVDRPLGIKGLTGAFTFTEKGIEGRNLGCAWDGLAFLGELKLLFASDGTWDLRLTSRMAEGDLSKILPMLALSSDVKGKFYTEKEGIQCRIHHRLDATDYFLHVKANVREIETSFFKEGEGLLEYDSAAQLVVLSQFRAKIGLWDVKTHQATLKALPTKPIEFDIELSQNGYPGFLLQGRGHLQQDNRYRLELSADAKRLLQLTFNGPDILWNLQWQSISAQGALSAQAYTLSSLVIPELPGVVFSTPRPITFQNSQCQHLLLIAQQGGRVVGELAAPKAILGETGLEIPGARLRWEEWKLPAALSLRADQALLKTGQDVLAISWKKGLQCRGVLQGLFLDVAKQDKGFSGRVKIQDGAIFSFFAKKEFFREIYGLELEGTWAPGSAFTGKVFGEEIALKGYRIHDLKGEITIQPQAISITHLQIDDPAGQFFVKQIMVRQSINGSWDTTIPLVKAQHFKPSLLRSLEGKLTKEKPFEIRSLVLSDLFCEGDNISHLRGKGSFHFTNRVKKESSIFDIPRRFIKDLGLDLDLFRPESGDVKCFLREGRIYLTELENSYSEGRHSQFLLATDVEPSYVDWKGKLHLNLRMKQDSTLKLGEPFVLTVRGTADKPSYGIR